MQIVSDFVTLLFYIFPGAAGPRTQSVLDSSCTTSLCAVPGEGGGLQTGNRAAPRGSGVGHAVLSAFMLSALLVRHRSCLFSQGPFFSYQLLTYQPQVSKFTIALFEPTGVLNIIIH